jgi:hypothetical protein
MKVKSLFFTIAAMFGMASCCSSGDVSITELGGIDMMDMSHLRLTATVDNGRCQTITVRAGKLALYDGRIKVLEMTLSESVRIPRRSSAEIVLPMAVRLENPLALMKLPRKLGDGDRSLNVTGEISGRMGLMSRTKKIEAMPLVDLLRELGADENDVKNMLSL